MLFGLFRRKREDTVSALYARCVGQARAQDFYARLGVPDTVDGRFELVVLHCGLAVARLSAGGPEVREVGRRLAEVFFADMDRSLREMGVGDLSVPKKMTKIAQAFYGRINAYKGGLSEPGDEALRAAVVRNVFDGKAPDSSAAAALAAYVRALSDALAAADDAAVAAGRIVFPDPAGFAPGAQP